MIRAYGETLLDKAQLTLACMFDFAVNDCGVDLNTFYNWFLNSDLSYRFARGESSVVAGRSGVEIAREILFCNDYEVSNRFEVSASTTRSREFWLGSCLAYYQWYKNISFQRITEDIGIDYIIEMYNPYHEMDIMSFVEAFDEIRGKESERSALKRLRKYAKVSQKMLADASGIPVRTIQQYEQGQKDISKASIGTVIALAKALHCSPEDLI